MEIQSILVIIALSLPVVASAITLIRKGWSWGAFWSMLLSLALFSLTLAIFFDTQEFSQNFPASSKIVLLEDNKEVIAGFTGKLSENETPALLTRQQVNEYHLYYENKEFNKIEGTHYKALIVSLNAFDQLKPEETVGVGNDHFTIDFTKSLLRADQPGIIYANEIIRQGSEENRFGAQSVAVLRKQIEYEIKQQLGDDAQIRAAFFGALLAKAIEQQKAAFILRGIKRKKIVLYEESFLFKVIKLVPEKLIDILVGEKYWFILKE